eukprot:1389183-Pyramimonas_sp.AAC.1
MPGGGANHLRLILDAEAVARVMIGELVPLPHSPVQQLLPAGDLWATRPGRGNISWVYTASPPAIGSHA